VYAVVKRLKTLFALVGAANVRYPNTAWAVDLDGRGRAYVHRPRRLVPRSISRSGRVRAPGCHPYDRARSVGACDRPRTTGTQAAKARTPSIATAIPKRGPRLVDRNVISMIMFHRLLTAQWTHSPPVSRIWRSNSGFLFRNLSEGHRR
jgi:hypothetical protein